MAVEYFLKCSKISSAWLDIQKCKHIIFIHRSLGIQDTAYSGAHATAHHTGLETGPETMSQALFCCLFSTTSSLSAPAA